MKQLIAKLLKSLETKVVDDAAKLDQEAKQLHKLSNSLDIIEARLRDLILQELQLAKRKQELRILKGTIENTIVNAAKARGITDTSSTSILKVRGTREVYDTMTRVPLDCTFKFNAKVTNRSMETEARLQEQADRHDQADRAKAAAVTDTLYVKEKAKA